MEGFNQPKSLAWTYITAGIYQCRAHYETRLEYQFSPGFLSNMRFDNVHTVKCVYHRQLPCDTYIPSLENHVKAGLLHKFLKQHLPLQLVCLA